MLKTKAQFIMVNTYFLFIFSNLTIEFSIISTGKSISMIVHLIGEQKIRGVTSRRNEEGVLLHFFKNFWFHSTCFMLAVPSSRSFGGAPLWVCAPVLPLPFPYAFSPTKDLSLLPGQSFRLPLPLPFECPPHLLILGNALSPLRCFLSTTSLFVSFLSLFTPIRMRRERQRNEFIPFIMHLLLCSNKKNRG